MKIFNWIRTDMKKLISSYYYGRALSRFEKSDYVNALKYIENAIKITNRYGDVDHAVNLYFAALCHSKLMDAEKAIYYAEMSLDIYRKRDDQLLFKKNIDEVLDFILNNTDSENN